MTCLQIQAKIIAVIEMVISSLFILLFGFVGIFITTKKDDLLEAMDKYPDDDHDHPHLRRLLEAPLAEQLSIFIVPMFYFIGELALGILLFRSVNQLNHKRLRLWFIITATLLAVGLIFFFGEILRMQEGGWDVGVVTLVNSVFTMYSMWVVYSLIGEIKAGGARHPVPYHNGFYKL